MSDFDPNDYLPDGENDNSDMFPGSPGDNFEFTGRYSGNDDDGVYVDTWTNTDPFVDHSPDWDRIATEYLNDRLHDFDEPLPDDDRFDPRDAIIDMSDAVDDDRYSIFSYGFDTPEEAWQDLIDHNLDWSGAVIYNEDDGFYYPAFDEKYGQA